MLRIDRDAGVASTYTAGSSMAHIIDLRSDTVTRPTAEMRRAMAEAAVGDDVYGEDPTVNRLEELGAAKLGKEAALFVPSGTMGNLISVLTHTPRGAEVILGDESHIYHYEQGGASAVGSCVFHPVATEANGELALDRIEAAIRNADNAHFAAPGVICLENTHNRRGGAVLSVEYCRQVRAIADRHGLPVHLDGARLANAAGALNVSLKELADPFDSVQFDLSKGLGAPVGGLVAGSGEFIKKARRYRKLLGGGMRQAGVIAAAGIVALEKMTDRLRDDHALARRLAEGLALLSRCVLR
jgi:threonine aldolase